MPMMLLGMEEANRLFPRAKDKNKPPKIEHKYDGLSPDELMAAIDDLPAEYRALIHEYGATPVLTSLIFGITDSKQLRQRLESNRKQNQRVWLNTDYVTPMADSVRRFLWRERGLGNGG